MAMENLSIKQRLFLLSGFFVIVLAAIAIITLFTINQNNKINSSALMAKELNTLTQKLIKHEKGFLLRDIHSLAFFETEKSKYIELFQKDYMSITKYIDSLVTDNYIADAGVEKEMSEINNLYKNYNHMFFRLIEEYKNRGFKDSGLVGSMRQSINNLEVALEDIGKSDRNNLNMVLLRRYELDYNLYKITKFIDKFNSKTAVFQKEINNSNITNNQKKNAISAILGYQKSFMEIVALDKVIGNNETEGLLGELHKEVSKLEPKVEQVLGALIEYSIKSENKSRTLLIILGMACLILTMFLSYQISRNIYKLLGGEPKLVAEIADNIAKGELRLKMDESKFSKGVMKSMFLMVQKLNSIVNGIINHADDIANESGLLNTGVQNISQGASEQASSVEEVSSTMEEITSNIEQNTNNAQSTRNFSETAYQSISELNAKSEESSMAIKTIADKIQIINEIAFQTNILALNAAVEAARAGDSGKGFAVVASEVRKLAERSKLAADEIVTLVSSSLILNENASELMEKTLPEVQTTNDLVIEIASASIEQKNGTNQINDAIQALNKITQQNAAASEKMATNAHELSNKAIQLKEVVAFFKISRKD